MKIEIPIECPKCGHFWFYHPRKKDRIKSLKRAGKLRVCCPACGNIIFLRYDAVKHLI